MSWNKISNDLHLKQVDNEELVALICSIFNGQSYNPQQDHIVNCGDRKIRFIYKSGSTKVREVERGENLTDEEFKEIKSGINKYLIEGKGKVIIASDVVFLNQPFQWNFQWNKQFQLCPLPPGNEMPSFSNALFPALLRYRYKETRYFYLNLLRSRKTYYKWGLLLGTIMPFINNLYITLRGNYTKHQWVIDHIEGKRKNKYLQVDYFPNKLSCFDKLNQIYFNNLHKIPAQFYKEYSVLIETFHSLNKEDQEKFLQGCYWYQKAVASDSQTSRLLNCTTMIESFLSNEKTGISERFKQFIVEHTVNTCIDETYDEEMKEYLSKEIEKKKKEMRKFATMVYDTRSEVVHEAIIMSLDDDLKSSSAIIPQKSKERYLLERLLPTCNQVLRTWLLKKSPSYQEGTTAPYSIEILF